MPRNCGESCVYFSAKVGCDIGVAQSYSDDDECGDYYSKEDAEEDDRQEEALSIFREVQEAIDETRRECRAEA